MSDTDAEHGTGSDVFPVDGGLHHWRLGFRQFSFHHIPRVPQHLISLRLDTTATFLACSGPFTFRIQVSHRTQEPPSEFFPAEPGIQRSASWRTGSAAIRASGGRRWSVDEGAVAASLSSCM
jgi:hypothetical protein